MLLKISSLNFTQDFYTKAFYKVIPQQGQVQRYSMRMHWEKKEKKQFSNKEGDRGGKNSSVPLWLSHWWEGGNAVPFPELLLYCCMKETTLEVMCQQAMKCSVTPSACQVSFLPMRWKSLAHPYNLPSLVTAASAALTSRESASFPGETTTRQLECFPQKKKVNLFLAFWINVVAKRLLEKECSVAPCSAALPVVQQKTPARCQPELRAPRRWRRSKIHAHGSEEGRKGLKITPYV